MEASSDGKSGTQKSSRPCENSSQNGFRRGVTTIESGMAHITGHDRSQTLLLPESLDDYVGPDNPVRFIDAFVDGLDLAAAGFAVLSRRRQVAQAMHRRIC